MKIILMVLSILFLTIGLVAGKFLINMIGAGAFIIYLVIDLIDNYKCAKRLMKSLSSPSNEETEKSSNDKLTNILGSIVTFTGLMLLCVGHISKGEDVWSWPGLTIWGGAILFYFFNGVMVREITGIPLRMGYGGWYVARRKQGRGMHSKSYNKYVGRK
jgi:TM2 domain-containing membrane protein YozV